MNFNYRRGFGVRTLITAPTAAPFAVLRTAWRRLVTVPTAAPVPAPTAASCQ
ncbi:hypothetical protein ACQ4M3_23580 [Leptolyngbya sp. AN03gr2]|uniref:hypothetical protein n=1 Tax=unclassified Leptolyngbya TaxID=2650499 RepID=UPI003D3173DE